MAMGVAAAGAAPLLPSRALALGKSSEVTAGQIRSANNQSHREAALSRLFWDAGKRTAINFAASPVPVDLERSDDLFFQPLLSWSGEKAFAPLSEKARARLARHLRYGGMLWVDCPTADGPFAQSVVRELDAVFPQKPMEPLKPDHVLFKSYFLIKRAVGKTTERGDGGSTGVVAIEVSGRAAVVMTTCDCLGAYERDQFGTYTFSCQPGGEAQRERAFRFGANLMMYATCLDYKADQVHIPFILKKRRR